MSIMELLKQGRVVSFKRIGKHLRLREQCDHYHQLLLTPNDVEQLISELQAELEQMKLEEVEPW